MNKRVFYLIPIYLIALGLVLLVLVTASAASVDKPTGAISPSPPSRPVYQGPVARPAPANRPPGASRLDRQAGGAATLLSFSPVDQMRQAVVEAPHAPAQGLNRVEFWLNQSSMSYIWGGADPGETITVTTLYEQFNATADTNGEWGSDQHEIYPGDAITVEGSSGGTISLTIYDPIEVHADSELGQVWGQVGDWLNRDVEVYHWWGGDMQVDQTDENGDFQVATTGMPRGAMGYLRFEEFVDSIQVVFHRPYYDIVPGLRVNYAHEWVENDYEPGYSVWITLTNATGEIKDTASGTTGMIPWWGGATGFSTGYNVLWASGLTPDIEPGDWVYASLEGSYSNQVQLGTIDGVVDDASDTVAGTINAAWFTQTLGGGCGVWVQDGPGIDFEVDPDGGSYLCDFSGLGWDLVPGMDVGVNYWEPDSDQVINVFRNPAPHLWIGLWGQGDAALGGNYVLNVDYNNDGDALAQLVTIEATLLSGMTYLGDTSGVVPSGTGQPGDPLVWDLGDLTANQWASRQFSIFVQVDGALDDELQAEASIASLTPYFQGDPESQYSYWSGSVVANNTDLAVDKWTWTWDPTPGTDFVYVVNVAGVGDTASTEVTLTDTLPLSTTLVDWWAQFPGWEEVSHSHHQLVLTRPSVPGGWGGDVFIRVHLANTASENMELLNRAEIFASNDLNPDNDSVNFYHNTNQPHTNLGVNKDWFWGNFVPGGEVGYEFRYENNGNVPVDGVVVTDTLPVGASFLYAYESTDFGPVLVTPTLVTPAYLVWDIGHLENGEYGRLSVVVKIDPATAPGSMLTNIVAISPKPGEDTYVDNSIAWTNRVNDPGPNLSVDKHTNWRWTSEGQIEFELRIQNLGTERLENFTITDTYPVSTTVAGWWQNHGPMITMSEDTANHLFTMQVEGLNPGETASVGYSLDVEAGLVGVEGLAYPNTVEAPIAGDTNTADNIDTVIAYTGPDVFITKRLSGGELRAGEIVTFTVEFGNQNRWPWDGDSEYSSHITDTLPAEMSFIQATQPGDPTQPWYPILLSGNRLVWEWGPMWNNSVWSFEIVAQLDADLEGGDVLTNRIEAFGDSPNDTEPDWENNVYELVMTVEEAPQAAFTTNSPVRLGEAMVFSNASSPGYPLAAYSWDFGDGETASDENPTHLYAAAGTYTVTLTASNVVSSSSFELEVEVQPALVRLPLIMQGP